MVPPEKCRKELIKSVHDDVHCGITATQKRLKLKAWWLGNTRDVRKCPKCAKIKNFRHNKLHCWPKETEPWSRVPMHHTQVNGVGLLVDASSAWPEVFRV